MTNERLIELERHVQQAFPARERAYHEGALLPRENLQELFERGLLTATVARKRGGLGSHLLSDDPWTFLQAIRIIARVSPGTAHCLQLQNHTAWMLDELGTPAQHQRYLQPLLRQLTLGSLVGSEAGRRHMYLLNTKARRSDGGWVINGHKNYATNGLDDGFAVIFASIEGEEDPIHSHFMAIVEPGMPGLTVNNDWYRPTGMRASPSPEILLENVFVTGEQVLGQPGDYVRGRWQGRFHLGFAANYLGSIEGAYQWVLQYLRGRGRASDGLVQLRVGEARTQIYGAQIAFEQAIAAWRDGQTPAAELAAIQAKTLCGQAAREVARVLTPLAGSTALFDDYPLGRLLRDIDTHTLHVGHDRTAQIVGAAELGESFDSTLQR